MSKITLFIMSLCAALCPPGIDAQEPVRQVLTIDRMFSLADQNGKSLKTASTAVREAAEEVRIARTANLPDLDVSLSFSYIGDGYMCDRVFKNGYRAPMPHFGNNLAVEASQVVYSGGGVSNKIRIARLQEENARLELENSRSKLRFVLLGYYLDLFKQKNLLQVYDKNIEQTRQVLKDIRGKGTEGIVLKNDITRYELLLSDLELTRIQIRNTLETLNDYLVTTLGLPDRTQIEPDPTLLSAVWPVNNKTSWTERATGNSYLLKQLTLGKEISRRAYQVTRSERLPHIALFAGNKLDGPILIEVPPLNNNFNYWYAGVGIRYNISSLYKTNKAMNKSKLAIRHSQEAYADTRQQTELAVRAGHIHYLEAYERLDSREKSVELARQNYSVILNRYQNGMSLITDMLDASNARLSSETEWVNARIDIVFDYYKLLYLSGTL